MNSGQSKMRTNGMFLRNFDSKRYQELQLQKEQILHKQKELEKRKEKKAKKERKRMSKKFDQITESAEETLSDTDQSVNSDSTCNESTCDGSDSSEVIAACMAALAADGNVSSEGATNLNEEFVTKEIDKAIQGATECDTVVDNAINEDLGASTCGVTIKLIKSEEETVNAQSNDGDKSKVLNSKEEGEVLTPAVIPAKASKEYAIIAKINKQALLSQTELVEQESGIKSASDSESEKSSKVNQSPRKHSPLNNNSMNGPNKKAAVQGIAKSKAQAYAIVDLDETMTITKLHNGTTKIKIGPEVTKQMTDNDSKHNSKEHIESLYRKRYMSGRMSRSAGYNGDLDTSTSSLETDIDTAIDQYLLNKLGDHGNEKLVITEEDLSGLHYLASSSSG